MITTLVHKKALEKVYVGVLALANLVKSTMGPRGRNVLIKRGDFPAYSTKDGVTVAESIDLGNDEAGIGVSLVKQAARRTVNVVGDGTTASVLLAQELIEHGKKYIDDGVNPVALKKGMAKAVGLAIDSIESSSADANDKDLLVKVATISSNNDEGLGKLIGEAVYNVGKFGDVKVENSLGINNSVEYRTGYTIARGYESPHFVTNDAVGEARYSRPYVALFNQKIYTVDEIQEVCSLAADENRPLVIVAHAFDENVLHLLEMNNRQNKTQFAAVQAEGVSKARSDVLNDLAILSGATILPDLEVTYLAEALGEFDKITIKREETTFVGGVKGNEEVLEAHIETLKALKADQTDYVTYGKTKERLAKLINGVGIIKIGGETPVELKETMDRVDDAIKATRAALKHGVVVGGGLVYLRACTALEMSYNEDLAYKEGFDVVMQALTAPTRTIAENAGENGNKVLEKLFALKLEKGYNALTGEYVDLAKAGVYDPVLVSTSALKAAASVAEIILTSSGVIYSAPVNPYIN